MVKSYKISMLPGDGIGPEVLSEAKKVLDAIAEKYTISFEFVEGSLGGDAIDKFGHPFPDVTLKTVLESDAVLMGAIGDFKYDTLDPAIRPERGLLALRNALAVFANIRPAIVYDELACASTLREDVVRGTDIIIVRELTGGLYFGQPKGRATENGQLKGYNTMVYSQYEIERIAHVAFQIAQNRQKRVCSVDKANVLDVSQVWREVVEMTATQYPDIELSHMYVDNAAMQLIKNPKQFDVILTENTFGDILSDEAAMLTGSLGMLPSASIGDGSKPFLYEPAHGSAPSMKGQNKANPIATILSAAMMMEYSFKEPAIAKDVESVVREVLKRSRTYDIAKGFESTDITIVSTTEMGDLICEKLLKTPVVTA